MRHTKIAFFGNFGTQNLGNECTLQAILGQLRKHAPEVNAECICPAPDDAAVIHNIAARQMSYRNATDLASRVSPWRDHPVTRLLRRIFVRIPRELVEVVRAFRILKGTHMLIMPGTGMLADFGSSPFGMHYELAKWSLIAKLRRCKILFVSVGGGRLRHPLSRWFIKSALSFADYRSYRDAFSKAYLDRIGIPTSRDSLFPDLAFSLPRPETARDAGKGRVIGVGLMEYYGQGRTAEDKEQIYQQYLDNVTTLVGWLLARKYTVRLLIGDVVYDKRVRQDVIERLNKNTVYEKSQLISEPLSSVDQLLAQLMTTDMVIATRFHNVVLALLLGKPVVSISYDEKNDLVMASVGLGDYCHSIERIDVDTLVKQFIALQDNASALKTRIEHKVKEFRSALDTQYEAIFGTPAPTR